jgi:hypothetical protein
MLRIIFVTVLAVVAVSGCQKQCKKGKPCGNACISKEYTCNK